MDAGKIQTYFAAESALLLSHNSPILISVNFLYHINNHLQAHGQRFRTDIFYCVIARVIIVDKFGCVLAQEACGGNSRN